jgi:hypothetical protein
MAESAVLALYAFPRWAILSAMFPLGIARGRR